MRPSYAGTVNGAGASCPVGKAITRGGARVVTLGGSQREKVALTGSYPSAGGSPGFHGVWIASGVVLQTLTGNEKMVGIVSLVCA